MEWVVLSPHVDKLRLTVNADTLPVVKIAQ